MHLSRGEQVPKHKVELLVYIFSTHPSSKQPLAMLQRWVEGIHEYSWEILSAYGQTQEEALKRALDLCPDEYRTDITNNLKFNRSFSLRGFDNRVSLPNYLEFGYKSHEYTADISITQNKISQALWGLPYHSVVKEKEYGESLRRKYPHPSLQRQLAESLMKQEELSTYVSLIKSVSNVDPSLSELENSLSKLPYSLLNDIDRYGFDGDNIDNQILAYLEDLDPTIIGDLQKTASR